MLEGIAAETKENSFYFQLFDVHKNFTSLKEMETVVISGPGENDSRQIC